MALTEAEELELLELENKNAAAAKKAPRKVDAVDAFAGGLAQKPLPDGVGLKEKAAHMLGETALPAIGAGLATPGGPALMALGAATGRMAQKTLAGGIAAAERLGKPEAEWTHQKDETVGQVAKDVGVTGVLQGALATVTGLAGEALNTKTARALGRKMAEGGGQLLRVMTNVKPKTGAAVLSDLEKFTKAPSGEAVQKAYDEFYAEASKATGKTITGRKESIRTSGDPFETVARSMKDMREAFQKLRDKKIDLQEAINASQAGRKIRDMKMRGNELAQEVAETADDLKGEFDDFIEANVPANLKGKWAAVREMNFWREASREFSSLMPQNVNTFPNALRGNIGLAGGAAAGALGGGPVGAAAGAAVGLAAQSPLLYGMGLRGAHYAGKGSVALTRAAMQSVPALLSGPAGTAADSVLEAYRRRKGGAVDAVLRAAAARPR